MRFLRSFRDAAIVADAVDGRVLHWNSAAAALFGRPGAEPTGRIDVFLPGIRATTQWLAARAGGNPSASSQDCVDAPTLVELVAQRGDGQQFRAELSLSPLEEGPLVDGLEERPLGEGRPADGGPSQEAGRQVVACIRDASGRGQVTATLNSTPDNGTPDSDQLRQVLDSLPEGVILADVATGRFVVSNAAAVELMGLDVTGSQVPFGHEAPYGIRRLGGPPIPADELPLQRALLHGETVAGEQFSVRRATDGRDIPLLLNSAPLRDRSGAVVGALVVFQDISDIKDSEEHKDQFLAAVSHDLKDPLSTILGWAQLLRVRQDRRGGPAAAEDADGLQAVYATATRMATMIDELLDLGHVQMGRPLELDRSAVELGELVDEVAAERRQTTDRHRIALHRIAPALVGNWDRGRLARVVSNLISNAVKYSPEGGDVVIAIDREEEPVRRGEGESRDRCARAWAVLRIADQGIGIPPAEVQRVFERFYRASNVVGRVRGTGIGLTMAREIVEEHGGTIAAESRQGGGTTVTLRLPLDSPGGA